MPAAVAPTAAETWSLGRPGQTQSSLKGGAFASLWIWVLLAPKQVVFLARVACWTLMLQQFPLAVSSVVTMLASCGCPVVQTRQLLALAALATIAKHCCKQALRWRVTGLQMHLKQLLIMGLPAATELQTEGYSQCEVSSHDDQEPPSANW